MNIFMSLDTRDRDRIEPLKRYLESLGHRVYVAIDHFDPSSQTTTAKIMSYLQKADLFFVVLTDNSLDSQFVQQEIGTADALEIPTISVVQDGVQAKVSGWLYGRDMIILDLDSPNPYIFARMNPYLLRVQRGVSLQTWMVWGFLSFLSYTALFGEKGIVTRLLESQANKGASTQSK